MPLSTGMTAKEARVALKKDQAEKVKTANAAGFCIAFEPEKDVKALVSLAAASLSTAEKVTAELLQGIIDQQPVELSWGFVLLAPDEAAPEGWAYCGLDGVMLD